MANFGVVPLLRLATFLFLPPVLALRFLLLVVIFVHETIICSIGRFKIYPIHLPDRANIVKAISTGLFLLLGTSNSIHANTLRETLVMAKGEQIALEHKQISQYSLGNKEILSARVDSKDQRIYLKGKSIGFTDLILWAQTGKKHYLIYVVSKRDHLEQAKILELFPPPLWKANFIADTVTLVGELNSKQQWNGLISLQQKKNSLNVEDVVLEPNFKRHFMREIYQELHRLGMENFRCEIKVLPRIDCRGIQELASEQLHLLQTLFPGLLWIKMKKFANPKNLLLRLKLLSFDYDEGEDWQKGVDFLKGNLGEVFDAGIWSMLKRNPINFNQYWNKMSVLAEPEFSLLPNTKAKFHIGSEIPYHRQGSTQEEATTEWKFAGLSIEVKVSNAPRDHQFYIHYQTELTAPNQEHIEGHKQTAEILVDKNAHTILFEISYKSLSQNKSVIPFWSKIPILNVLFSSDSKHQSNKKILAALHLKDG